MKSWRSEMPWQVQKKGQENRCSPLKKRIGNTITLEKPNGYQFKTSRYRNVVTRLVSESQWYAIVTKMYHQFRYKIVSPRWNGQSWIWLLLKRITRLRLGDKVSSLQNRITKPYLRLGDTIKLRYCLLRQGDFTMKGAYHRITERITRVRLGDASFSLLNRITKWGWMMQLYRYQSVSPGFSLQKCIIKVRLGDAAFSLPKCITGIFVTKV